MTMIKDTDKRSMIRKVMPDAFVLRPPLFLKALYANVVNGVASTVYTIPAKTECIVKFITEPTKNGGERIFAVYNDVVISDLIPVSYSRL